MKANPFQLAPGLATDGDPVQNEAERMLAAIILGWFDNDGAPAGFFAVADRLSSEDWTDPLWRAVWNTVSAMVEDSEVVTVVSVVQRLRTEFGNDAGNYAARRIGVETVSVLGMPKTHALLYAKTLREARRKREATNVGKQLLELSKKPGTSPVEIVEQAQEKIAALAALTWEDTPIESDSLSEAYDSLCVMKDQGGVDPTAIKTSYSDLDNKLLLRPRALTVVGGVTGTGKTTLTVNIAEAMAKAGKRVLLFSLEMGAVEIQRRRYVSESLLPISFFMGWKSGPPDWKQRLDSAKAKLKQRAFSVVYAADLSATAIRAHARREKVKNGLDVVIVDYIQLVEPPKVSDNRARDVATVSRAMKALAMELDVLVLAVSQLSRMPGNRKHGEPLLTDLRESGAIEQDSDNVMLLWKHPEDAPGVARLKVAKQRDGEAFGISMFHDAEHFRFASLALSSQEDHA